MTLKIWTVSIEVEGLVVAESEAEARKFARAIVDDAGAEDGASASEWKLGNVLPDGWDLDTILYCSGAALAVGFGVDRTVQEWHDELNPPDDEPKRCELTIDLFDDKGGGDV